MQGDTELSGLASSRLAADSCSSLGEVHLPIFNQVDGVFFLSHSNKSLLRKLLVDSGGLLLALQPLACDAADEDDERPAECGRLLSDWFSSPPSGLTSRLHSLYFSLLVGCLSSLMGGVKTEPGSKHCGPASLLSVGRSGFSPPLCKRPRLADVCAYALADSDLVLLLDDGTRVLASRVAVVGGDGTCGVGSEYFRGLLRGGFGEAQGEDAIRIRDVSRGMLLPVLHYLHGCRLTEDAGEHDGGRCQVLDRLVLEGLGASVAETGEDAVFQDTALGQMMMGACRFLVTALQRELEDLCVSLLLSRSAGAAAKSDNLESAEESLANRTSELELTGVDVHPENSTGQKASCVPQPAGDLPSCGASRRAGGGASAASDDKTIQSVAKSSSVLDPGGLRPAGGGALVHLLPQLYWFSQRYSYPALGRACLSLLLGGHDRPRTLWSASEAGGCLRRLAREADCTETLKQDLLRLATAALS